MRYDEFRDRFQDALRETGLVQHVHLPAETMDLARTSRRWEVYVHRSRHRTLSRFTSQQGGAPPTPRSAAAADLTGYWVSVVTEDWEFRMLTPPKGEFGGLGSIPINDEGKRAANTWDPAKDEAAGEQCRSYGAAALMRVPGRLHITWENDNTLRIDTDAGTQTPLLHFGASKPPEGEPTWQGYSAVQWEGGARGGRGSTAGVGGSLKGVTTHMRPGIPA